ncbi:alpha-hydroxy-acid oxidizing protein, partial [Acinetobacter baumannii]
LHPRWAVGVMLRALLAGGVPSYEHYPEAFRSKLGRETLSDEVALARDVTWTDVALLRRQWRGKLVLKGILSVDDARSAAAHGCDAIVVSNH